MDFMGVLPCIPIMCRMFWLAFLGRGLDSGVCFALSFSCASLVQLDPQ